MAKNKPKQASWKTALWPIPPGALEKAKERVKEVKAKRAAKKARKKAP